MERELLTRRGFSRVELLITIALLALVGSIAISETVSSRTRSEVARVRMDLRRVALALEAYHADHAVYPILNGYVAAPPYIYDRGALVGMWSLTTPVAYLKSVNVQDPFGRAVSYPPPEVPAVLSYLNVNVCRQRNGLPVDARRPGWYLHSRGPDRVNGPHPLPYLYRSWYLIDLAVMPDPGDGWHYTAWQYDPSNGTVSNGDILSYQWRR